MTRSHFDSAIVNDRKSQCGDAWNYYKAEQDEPIHKKKQGTRAEKTHLFVTERLTKKFIERA